MASTTQHQAHDFQVIIELLDGDQRDSLQLSQGGEMLLTLSNRAGTSTATFEGRLTDGSRIELRIQEDGSETWDGDTSLLNFEVLRDAPMDELRSELEAQKQDNPCDDCKALCFLQWLACITECWGEPVCTINCTIQANACVNGCPCTPE